MKQQKLDAYRPNYPKKILKGAVIATAATVALGVTVGCTALRTGGVPEPPPVEEMGYIMPEPTPEPTEEPLVLSGDVMVAPEEP